tara:strand:+ start:2687 stop:3112 length:426 start_codon:yes stop_codon:yes gene_type:complete
MALTAYNGKSDPSGVDNQTLVNHTNSSGGVERIIISFIRTHDHSPVNGYFNIKWGNASDLINIQVTYHISSGKNTALGATGYNTAVYQNSGNYMGHTGGGGGENGNLPTELYIADGEKFMLTSYGSSHMKAYSILVIPEGS